MLFHFALCLIFTVFENNEIRCFQTTCCHWTQTLNNPLSLWAKHEVNARAKNPQSVGWNPICMHWMLTHPWGHEAESICSICPPSKTFSPTLHSTCKAASSQIPSFFLNWCPLDHILLQVFFSHAASVFYPLEPQMLRAGISLLWGGLWLTPTYTLFIYRHHNISHVWACGAWGLTCGSNLSQHWEMKWYTEIIQRWLTNEQDLMSNPNIFRQHEPWLHGHTSESPAPRAVWGTLQTSAKNYHWVKVSVLDHRQSTQKQWFFFFL